MFWELLFLSSALKSSLFLAYHSTDFEVHRNWLAITYALPINQWYTEATSRWTLDYPPFFAWFEWLLSQIASYVDPLMVQVENLDYASPQTVIFQRTTVMLTELVLLYALYRVSLIRPSKKWGLIAILTFLHPSLFIVDHIHFQYNGFIFGILLLSLCFTLEGNFLASGAIFAALLNFKHIFLYIAPAYFVFLLKGYCMERDSATFARRFLVLGSFVLGIFTISLGPFVYFNQMPQLGSRLFPFQRGLISTYWASNVWALYTFADRVLVKLVGVVDTGGLSTRGIEGEAVFQVLKQIKPIHTFGLTIASHLPALGALWAHPTPTRFIHVVALCGFGSYMFGWHVHEKAIMLVLFPLSLVSLHSPAHTQLFLFLSITGSFSIFPLLFNPIENLVQAVLLVTWGLIGYITLAPRKSLHPILKLYYTGLGLIYLYPALQPVLIHTTGLDLTKYAFITQMATSVYSSLGMLGSWAYLYRLMYLTT
ncbi:glycosyl transferase [Entomophthora muscae]|uniref:Glycosyl transferase n=1 Tax=Entomophthora muscae TaxID=34485 RepID=A0ACC2RVK4_9FUNG|nr:glycosyl transferase [Entomophthora muscae]